MRRQRIEFDEFKENFITKPDGYFPVCSEFAENDYSENLRVVQMDMICEWRLPDGKIIFVEVPFETEEQLNEIKEYLKVAAGLLNKAILEKIDKLSYAETVEGMGKEDDPDYDPDEDDE